MVFAPLPPRLFCLGIFDGPAVVFPRFALNPAALVHYGLCVGPETQVQG